MAPITVGYLPFGLLVGAAVARSTDPLAAWAGTDLIYGGSAHLTLIELLRTGSGLWAAAGAALLINARLLVYSSSLIPLWGPARVTAKLLAAAAVIDPTWMIANRRAEQGGTPAQQRAHFAGAACVLTIGWTTAVSAGMFLGAAPAIATLFTIAVPLCLLAIVVPHTRLNGGLIAVGSAAIVTLVTTAWPPGTGLLVVMAAAGLCGAVTSRRSS
jgi:predicted branched-subunit amino acid permease